MEDDQPPPSLASVIDAAMLKQQTTGYRELARRSESLGVPISHTTLASMHRGTYGSELSKEMRARLATLAGMTVDQLNGVTGYPDRQPFLLPDSADSLSGDQREAVLAVVRAFARTNAEHRRSRREASDGHSPAKTRALADELSTRRQGKTRDPAKAAARKVAIQPGDDDPTDTDPR